VPSRPAAAPSPAPPAPAAPPEAGAAGHPFPTRDELTLAWGDQIVSQLPLRARSRFRPGRFTGVEGETAQFALPDAFLRDRCAECLPEVEHALSNHFGRRIRLRLVVEGGSEPAPSEDEPVVWEELTDAPPGAVASPIEHVLQAFQGAEVVEE
jgi:hypothetical protein